MRTGQYRKPITFKSTSILYRYLWKYCRAGLDRTLPAVVDTGWTSTDLERKPMSRLAKQIVRKTRHIYDMRYVFALWSVLSTLVLSRLAFSLHLISISVEAHPKYLGFKKHIKSLVSTRTHGIKGYYYIYRDQKYNEWNPNPIYQAMHAWKSKLYFCS